MKGLRPSCSASQGSAGISARESKMRAVAMSAASVHVGIVLLHVTLGLTQRAETQAGAKRLHVARHQMPASKALQSLVRHQRGDDRAALALSPVRTQHEDIG